MKKVLIKLAEKILTNLENDTCDLDELHILRQKLELIKELHDLSKQMTKGE